MKSELTTNIAEVNNTKLTNVNEQISANKEELKSDLKGIGDKLTTMDKKFEENNKELSKDVSISFRDLEKLKESQDWSRDEFKLSSSLIPSLPSSFLHLSPLCVKIQSPVADANQWDPRPLPAS
ncbi:hypothetical protein TNCV_2614951 [Trichonephila clavipes]|nr:hypothetical protein TNCV_2614951 [Trichonephila clavipes]